MYYKIQLLFKFNYGVNKDSQVTLINFKSITTS